MQPSSPFMVYKCWSTAIRNTLRYLPEEFFCPLARKPFFRYDIILCLYQQVSAASTLICNCINRYLQPRHSFVSTSAGIRVPHPYLYVYQQVSAAPTLICISRYPHPSPLFVRVSASIRGLHTHLYFYQQVSPSPTLICTCINRYP